LIDPSFWAGRRVLLTGHTGFKGAWLALWLQRMGADVHGFALPPDSEPALFDLAGVGQTTKGGFGDLRDRAAVDAAVRSTRPQIVLHLAARALVRASIADPVDALGSNVMGTAHLLEALRQSESVSTIVVVTSDKVYANDESGRAFDETTPLGGKDPYSASKAATEMVVRAYRETYFRRVGVKLATARGGNVIGGGDYSADRIVPDIIRAASRGEKPVLRMPMATRPWQHALDCLAGYLCYAQALERGENPPDALNFGPEPSQPITVAELTKEMLAALGRPTDYVHEPVPGSVEMKTLAVDADLARRLLGWRDALPGRKAIEWTAEWHRRTREGEAPRAVTLDQIDRYADLLQRT
jgi:CDP-glucose 4,6-dehydratase